ncbi:MAG: hypothetical protein E7295_12040 [Lachnospiraceae bacterium]|jgi:RNA processing factor Prp31|nr:hypothetical protein [Lachnospiraceae bacterium]
MAVETMETIKTVLSDKKKQVTGKAKELSELVRLKRQINTCEEVIKRNQMEIGRMVYAQYEERVEAEENGDPTAMDELGMATETKSVSERFEKQCVAIANANRAIADLKKQIKTIQKKLR